MDAIGVKLRKPEKSMSIAARAASRAARQSRGCRSCWRASPRGLRRRSRDCRSSAARAASRASAATSAVDHRRAGRFACRRGDRPRVDHVGQIQVAHRARDVERLIAQVVDVDRIEQAASRSDDGARCRRRTCGGSRPRRWLAVRVAWDPVPAPGMPRRQHQRRQRSSWRA